MAKVLLADTNFSAGPIREYLFSQGHEVHLAGGKHQDFLAKCTPNYHVCNYAIPEQLSALAQQLGADHVLPGCNDQSYLSCAKLMLGANLDTLETTLALADKGQFRELAARLGLHTPRLIVGEPSIADYPLVVKPANAYSGHGITILKAHQASSLEQAISLAKSACREGRWVVETFVEGQLYSHSAFLSGQAIVWDTIVAEYCSANPFVVDSSYVIHNPDQTITNIIRQDIEKLAHHLQLKDGLIHTQFIAGPNGLAIIELTRRCPGDLYSHLIRLSTGMDYVGAYADALMGKPWGEKHIAHPKQRHILRHTVTSPQAMRLTQMRFHQPLNLVCQINLATTGDAIEASPLSRIALLFAEFETQEQLQLALKRAVTRSLYDLYDQYYLAKE